MNADTGIPLDALESQKIFYQLFNQRILKTKNFFMFFIHANRYPVIEENGKIKYEMFWFRFAAEDYQSIKDRK